MTYAIKILTKEKEMLESQCNIPVVSKYLIKIQEEKRKKIKELVAALQTL